MQTIQSVSAMQRTAQEWRRRGVRVGFVPTMGCLHEGHYRLVRRARREVGREGKVVVSIFVNPTQFGPQEDFRRYPRTLEADVVGCREAGADVVFHPTARGIYGGEGRGASTQVVEGVLSQQWEGRTRPTHFAGVTTVVAILFHLVQPEVAVFGAKDWQQAAVVRRMIRDLHLPVRLVVAPTVRALDGLALSSRNRYLSSAERTSAVVLSRMLRQARDRVRREGAQPAAALEEALKEQMEREPGVRVDYLALVHPETLERVATARRGVQLIMAAWVGSTRLIDNGRL